MTGPRVAPSRRRVGQGLWGLLAVLLVAACLRPAITSVGPVLDLIGADTGLGHTALGLLGALPLAAFAVVSPLVHAPQRRLGIERMLLLALVALALGTVVRSLPPGPALWVGTLLIGAAIAVGNVLLPSLIKRDFSSQVSLTTGAYSTVMAAVAALASGVAVPIAHAAPSGWRLSLGVWAALAAVAALAWGLRMRAAPRSPGAATIGRHPTDPDVRRPPTGPTPSMWRSTVAWQVTMFMGLQSTTFYVLVTWLPTIEASHGVSSAVAGWHLFLYQLVGMVAGLVVTTTMGRRADQRFLTGLTTAPLAIAMLGLLVAPSLMLLWVLLAGFGSGTSFPLALTLMALRTRTPAETARLSGMAQSMGYVLAMSGPVAMGWLSDTTGSWQPVLVVIMLLALAQATAGFLAGRDRFTHLTVEPADASAR